MRTVRSFFRGACSASAASLALCFFVAGCGPSDGNRVSGTVTFDGKPVPAGKIYFVPDAGKGNAGITGYADIKDGKYDTSAAGGKGTSGGAVIVKIDGSDPAGTTTDPSGETLLKLLFTGYETTADLPTEATTKDFDVPVEAGNKKPGGDAKQMGGGV